MKTLFLFDEHPERTFFFELEGDYSHLQGIYINSTGPKEKQKKQKELNALVYRTPEEVDAYMASNHNDEKGDQVYLKVTILEAPTKDWDHFVKCGFYL